MKLNSNRLLFLLAAVLCVNCAEIETDEGIQGKDDPSDSGSPGDSDNLDVDDTGDSSSDSSSGSGSGSDSETDSGPLECTPENAATICGESPCVDGYCCDAPCDGICVACNIVSSEGICTFLPVAEDPDSECEQTNEADCGLSGVCDGAGACAFYDTDVVCDDLKACTGDDRCDGDGGCSGSTPVECAPGPLNACCEGACDDESGCYTVTGACTEICESQRLVTNQTCLGCGEAGAEGVCTGGLSTECDVSNLCQEMQCGGTTYHCTNFDSTFAWRTSIFCDDDNSCSFGDACVSDGVCSGTTYTCTGDYCAESQCDGQGGCTIIAQNEGNDCDTEAPMACPDDECVIDSDSAQSWNNYDDTCIKTCVAGTCADCTCLPAPDNCTAGGCCEADCIDSTGCFTKPGACSIAQDVCSASLLSITQACTNCGLNDAIGTCDEGEGGEFTCGSVNACESKICGAVPYYCVDNSGVWNWTVNPTCGDGCCNGAETSQTCTEDCQTCDLDELFEFDTDLLPTGWTIENGGTGTDTWDWIGPGELGWFSNKTVSSSGAGHYWVSGYEESEDFHERLVTKEFDPRGCNTVTLRFNHYFSNSYSDHGSMGIRKADGTLVELGSWTSGDSGLVGLIETDLTPHLELDSLFSVWFLYEKTSGAMYWQIDDVAVTGSI